MFGVGFFEMVIIAVVALVVVGPKRLPEVMRQAGRLFVHVRRTANDVRSTFDQVIREAEDEIRREEAASLRQALQPILDAKKDVGSLISEAHQSASAAVAPLGTHSLNPGASLEQALMAAHAPAVAPAAGSAPAAGQPVETPHYVEHPDPFHAHALESMPPTPAAPTATMAATPPATPAPTMPSPDKVPTDKA